MDLIVHSRSGQLGDDVRELVTAKVSHAVRVFEQAVERIDVEVAEETNPRRVEERHRVEVTAVVGGRIVRIESAAATVEAAVDDASDRLTRRLRRLKERIIDRSRQAEPIGQTVSPPGTEEIVRVKQFVMKPMNIEEAILQMEMLGHSFFFFHNAATDRHSVLYRRRDGRLGLIEAS